MKKYSLFSLKQTQNHNAAAKSRATDETKLTKICSKNLLLTFTLSNENVISEHFEF